MVAHGRHRVAPVGAASDLHCGIARRPNHRRGPAWTSWAAHHGTARLRTAHLLLLRRRSGRLRVAHTARGRGRDR
eukprot:11351762-Alexandrium_andersonii.AAC.1